MPCNDSSLKNTVLAITPMDTQSNAPAFPLNSGALGHARRELLAALAMHAILASPDFIDKAEGADLPAFAVQWADDLIEALNNKPPF